MNKLIRHIFLLSIVLVFLGNVAFTQCNAPTLQPTNLALTSTLTTIAGTFTSEPSADNYLIIRSTISTLSAVPISGTIYSDGDTLGGGFVVKYSVDTMFSDINLNSGTQYYYYVFAANCIGSPQYLITNPITNNIIVPNNYIPDTNIGWKTMINSGNYSISEIQLKAEAYFASHPEIDTIAPLEKAFYRRWANYWGNRSTFVNGDTVFTKMNDIIKHLTNLEYSTNPITGKKWELITPKQDDYQDLGVVTCIWNNPTNDQTILVGTESSGLWKTTDGGQNWNNITDSYTGAQTYNANYPFGVLSIAVKPSDTNIILIAASIPTFDGPYGIGILKSLDGGNTWSKTYLFGGVGSSSSTLSSSGVESYSPIYKIKFDPWDNNIIYAIGMLNIYASSNLFGPNSITLILDGDGVSSATPFTDPVNQNHTYDHMQLKDFEVICSQNCVRLRDLVVSTYSYDNVTAQLAVGLFDKLGFQVLGNTKWTNVTNELTINNILIDVISLTLPNSFIENDQSNVNVFAGYRTKLPGDSYSYKFNIDKFIIGDNDFFGNIPNSVANATPQYYFNLSSYDDRDDRNPCAGFGMFYNDLKAESGNGDEVATHRVVFVVGGFGITLLQDNGTPSLSPHTCNYTINHPPSETFPYPDEHYGKNRSLHYGVKNIFLSPNHNGPSMTFTCFVGTEGGISSFSFDYTAIPSNLVNKNGNGLSIQQFNDIASTKNNSTDIIVGSAMHNGYWGRTSTSFPNWVNTWLDNSARVVINDIQPSYIYYYTYLPGLYPNYLSTYTTNGYPTSPMFMSSDQGYKLDNIGSGLFGYDNQFITFVFPMINNLRIVSDISWSWVYNSPLILDDADPNANTLYLGSHNVWKSIDNGNSWNTISNFTQCSQSLGLKALAKTTVEGNDIIYAAFERPTWCLNQTCTNSYVVGSDYSQCYQSEIYKLFKYSSGTGIWQDITGNIDNNNSSAILWANITDMVINPDNHYELWMTMGSFWQSPYTTQNIGLNRVLHSTDGGASWSDFTKGLPVVPVNCIKLIKDNINPTNYMLIVGTDIGVYTINNVGGSFDYNWSAYNDGLPLTIVTDIEVWDKGRKIRAATWGRGIYEAEIPCMSNFSGQTCIITPNTTQGGTTTWTDDKNAGAIYIQNGATLTIKSRVCFLPTGYVYVEPGGKLIVDGGVLCACPGMMWKGVQVYGDFTVDQTQISQHGKIQVINNGTIQDALVAIQTFDINDIHRGAGIINAQNAKFINNQVAIYMQHYTNRPNGTRFKDFSYFKNCDFITNDLYHDPSYNFLSFINLDRIWGLDILGCKFENNTSNIPLNSAGNGINGSDANFTVKDFNNIVPEFYKLKYGIYATALYNTNNFTVMNSVFDNNFHGIYALGSNSDWFTSNTFKTPNIFIPGVGNTVISAYGMYLDHCSDYTVEGNSFDKISNSTNKASYGLIINESGTDYNLIYNNTFTNIEHASTQAQGNNIGTSQYSGLKILCNDYSLNKQDITVIPLISGDGISEYQGHNSGSPNDYTAPAGNTFSKAETFLSDFRNLFGSAPIIYYHHAGIASDIWVPDDGLSWNNFINTNTYISYPTTDRSLACPAIALQPGLPNNPDQLNNLLTQSTIQMNTAQLIHDIWIDGGNTAELKQAVELSYPWETFEIYNKLISASPYLSDEVMFHAIEQTDVLPDIMIYYILAANPQAINSIYIQQAIYDYRMATFGTYSEELYYQTDTVSPRQQLEANVSYYTSQRKIYLNLLKNYYLADTTGNGLNNLINLLSNETDIRSLYELVFAQISNQNIKGSTSTLAAIGNQIDPDKQPEEMDKFNKMNAIIPALISIDTGDSTWGNISDFTKSLLIDYSVNDRGLPGSIATAIRLHFDSTFVYDEPIYTYDDDTTSRMAKLIKKVNKPLSEETYLKISPNPANEYIIVSYNITSAINGLRLFIIDASGKTLFEKELNKAKDQQILTVKNYANGNYICTLFNNGKPIKSEKFIKN